LDLQEEQLAIDVAESELILESDTDFNLVNEEETEQLVEEITEEIAEEIAVTNDTHILSMHSASVASDGAE